MLWFGYDCCYSTYMVYGINIRNQGHEVFDVHFFLLLNQLQVWDSNRSPYNTCMKKGIIIISDGDRTHALLFCHSHNWNMRFHYTTSPSHSLSLSLCRSQYNYLFIAFELIQNWMEPHKNDDDECLCKWNNIKRFDLIFGPYVHPKFNQSIHFNFRFQILNHKNKCWIHRRIFGKATPKWVCRKPNETKQKPNQCKIGS